MLYAGKISGVLVVFLFLPLYNRLLGAEQFGVVAVILSLQALLMMLDLGMSTLVCRDVAAAESSSTVLLKLIHTAETSLSGFYLCLLLGTVLFKAFGGLASIDFGTVIAIVVLFWILVLQNLYYSIMLARRAFTAASTIQFIGVVLRAAATVYVLSNVSASLTAFIMTQLFVSAIHFCITRLYCRNLFKSGSPLEDNHQRSFTDSVALLSQGRSLALFALAGAAVMQLDKPIVSFFMSAAQLAPYFLAATICMVPISILAGPVTQYFQPTLLNAVAEKNTVTADRTIRLFVKAMLLVIVLPSLLFWLLRSPVIELWMGNNPSNVTIAHYVKILLPGFTFGAFGFIPYTLLLSVKDFKFQAALSVGMTIVTLITTAVCASRQSIEGICYVYAVYNTTSTLLTWFRAMYLPSTNAMAKLSFIMVSKIIIGFVCIAILMFCFFQLLPLALYQK
ncbi:MAG: hypothetical protein NVSMB40_12500 [Aquirhabdus sp.]